MSDPPKSTSSFSFAQPATSGSSGGIFSQPASGALKQGGGLFGSSASPSATLAPKPFNNTSTAGGSSSVFGGGGSNLFREASKSFTGSNFGQAQSNSTSGGLFSSGQPGSQNNQPSNSVPSSTAFPAFSTPNKSFDQPASGQSQASNLFGNSTTPAGPPPSNNSGAGSGPVLFGKLPQDENNLFGNLGTSSSAQGGNSTAAQSSAFRGFTPGASNPQETPAVTFATQTPSLFGSTPNTGASNVFGSNKRAAQPDSESFTNLNKTQDAGAINSATSQQPQSEAPNPSLFNLDGQQPTATSAAPTTSGSLLGDTASKSAFSFEKATQFQNPTSNIVASPSAAPSGFDLFKRNISSGPPAPSTSAPSGGMFSNLGKPQDKAATTTAETTAPSSSAPAPTSSLFAQKPADPAATSQAPAQPAATGAAQGTGTAAANLSASVAGPAPPAQSRLKNKSMDDIITRWASDLSKYQKEFQQQAEKVATWDRMLVENSEKIQKLYGSTLEAERATTEVERQLTAVENDQAELSMWLDHYEKEVDSMISSSVGQGDTLSGPDQERERTWVLLYIDQQDPANVIS